MDQKLFLVLSVIVIIIVASVFNIHVLPIDDIHKIPMQIVNEVLYVCPYKNTNFDSVVKTLMNIKNELRFVFFVSMVLLIISWSWAMYQTLLKDSFKKDPFKSPWFFTKIFFWTVVVLAILYKTPNFYKTVRVEGSTQKWILCEKNLKESKAVLSKNVKPDDFN